MTTKSKTKQVAVVTFDAPELSALPKSRAKQIRDTFLPMADMLAAFEQDYNTLIKDAEAGIDETIAKRAKRLRLDIAQVRIKTEEKRKEEKEEYLRAGKAIDGVSNILKWAVTEKENKLKEIETHQERKEQQIREKLQAERVELLSPYVDDAHERDLASMDADVWDIYLAGKQQQHKDRLEAERLAEQKRQDELERQAEIERLHQERLNETKHVYGYWANYWTIKWGEMSQEDYNRELQAAKDNQAHQEKLDKLNKARLAEASPLASFIPNFARLDFRTMTEPVYKRTIGQAQKAKKDQDEHNKKLQAERLEAQRKLKAKEEAERKEQEKLNAGDQAKLKYLADDLEALGKKYEFKAKVNKKKMFKIRALLTEAIEITEK